MVINIKMRKKTTFFCSVITLGNAYNVSRGQKTLSWKERQIVNRKEYGEAQHVHLNTADVNSLKLIFSFKSYIKTTQYEFEYYLKTISSLREN